MPSLWEPRRQAEIRDRLVRLHPDTPRRWGRMSASDMLAHLAQVLRVPLGDVHPTSVPGLIRFRPLAHAVIHWMPWPKGRIQSPAGAGGKSSSDFDADRRIVLELLERFTSKNDHTGWPPHPLFGSMSKHDWGVFSYRHLDHHLRQFGV